MSREELALETQLLLQEVTQVTQYAAVAAPESEDAPPLTELERAKQALVEKLRKKKEQQRQQRQQINLKRYGFAGASVTAPTQSGAVPASTSVMPSQTQRETASTGASPRVLDRLTPVKQKKMAKLPVIAGAPVTTRKKKDLLHQLRNQAIKQGAQEMAKLFGYSSYEEQIKHLNKIEKMKILQSEMLERATQENEVNPSAITVDDDEQEEQEEEEGLEERDDVEVDDDNASTPVVDVEEEANNDETQNKPAEDSVHVVVEEEETQDLDALERESTFATTVSTTQDKESTRVGQSPQNVSGSAPRRRRNQIAVDEDEDDGNDADSEKDENDADGDDEDGDKEEQPKNRDRAAAFRQLLQAEVAQTRQRKRLRKGGGDFVEDEAEEEEEEDVLKIGGLGDFGFGVPQAVTKESKEAEEERNALNLREDDLEGIVDDLSDDERAQEHDLQEIVRRETEEQDKEQVREVMRKVKEGFGRNRRAFSAGLDGGAGARGRFNLSELVAADGDKLEAARLGLLESDEEMNDDDDADKAENADKEEAEEEEDEEAEMERMLRDRFLNQPKIYITSSESENEEENEIEKDAADDTAAEELESDEERERQQMKLFSEKARINRRMQRMKEAQRMEEAEDEEGASQTQRSAVVPNLLLEEDEDSQALLNVLKRTDAATTGVQSQRKQVTTTRRPGRFNSFGMSVARSASSFSRVADNCKLFSSGSSTSTAKGFVFTAALAADRGSARADENEVPDSMADDDNSFAGGVASNSKQRAVSAKGSQSSAKRQLVASSGSGAAPRKKQKSGFFSVLSSFQAMPSSKNNSSGAGM